jgi:hypothetical protein
MAMQVIELWEREEHGGSGAPADRHFIQLLYNKKPLDLPGRDTNASLTLATFLDDVIGSFSLDPAHFKRCCTSSPVRQIPAVDTSSI